jgi:hypothetical protein
MPQSATSAQGALLVVAPQAIYTLFSRPAELPLLLDLAAQAETRA